MRSLFHRGERLKDLKINTSTSPEYLESIKEARSDYKAGKVKNHEEVFGG